MFPPKFCRPLFLYSLLCGAISLSTLSSSFDICAISTVYSMTTSSRPCTTIDSISICNSYNVDDNAWIPYRITIGTWVLLQSRRRKRKQRNDFVEAFKGQVKEFKVCAQSKRVKEVLIQHAFQHADLRLKTSPPNFPRHRPKYKF